MDHAFTLLIFMGKKSLQQGILLFLLLVNTHYRWGKQLTSHTTVIAKMTSKYLLKNMQEKKNLLITLILNIIYHNK